MATHIHHATQKRAAKAGIRLGTMENDIVAYDKDDKVLASGPQGNVVLDAAIAKLKNGTSPKRAELIASVENGKKYLAAKITPKKPVVEDEEENDEDEYDSGDVEGEDGSDDEDEPQEGASIVKHKYKKMYQPNKYTCGDDMSVRIAKAIKIQEKVTTKSGKTKLILVVSISKLKRLAQINGVWNVKYEDLNYGQARMAIGNRLRKLDKNGTAIKWI